MVEGERPDDARAIGARPIVAVALGAGASRRGIAAVVALRIRPRSGRSIGDELHPRLERADRPAACDVCGSAGAMVASASACQAIGQARMLRKLRLRPSRVAGALSGMRDGCRGEVIFTRASHAMTVTGSSTAMSQQQWPYNLPIWRSSDRAASPDGKLVAQINPATEISMGNPTYQLLQDAPRQRLATPRLTAKNARFHHDFASYFRP